MPVWTIWEIFCFSLGWKSHICSPVHFYFMIHLFLLQKGIKHGLFAMLKVSSRFKCHNVLVTFDLLHGGCATIFVCLVPWWHAAAAVSSFTATKFWVGYVDSFWSFPKKLQKESSPATPVVFRSPKIRLISGCNYTECTENCCLPLCVSPEVEDLSKVRQDSLQYPANQEGWAYISDGELVSREWYFTGVRVTSNTSIYLFIYLHLGYI